MIDNPFRFGTSDPARAARKIETALQEAGPAGLTRTEISALFANHAPADLIATALLDLYTEGKAEYWQEATSGRFAQRWRLK